MKKPKLWHMFRFGCELFDYTSTNMLPESQRNYCKRKDRKGNERPLHSLLRCHWNVCPRIKAGEKTE